MKRTLPKRILSLILLIVSLCVLTLSFASCANNGENVPDGMQIASCTDADYRLYVPASWTLNTSYGVSGAYAQFSSQSTVSMVRYGITDEMTAGLAGAADRLGWFYENHLLPAVELLAAETIREVEAPADTMLDTVKAKCYHYTVTTAATEESRLEFLQVVGERASAFYVFTFTANASNYELLLPDVEKMLDVFIFAEPYMPVDFIKDLDESADAPEGMKLASNDEVAYRFYVPSEWVIDREQRIFSAYVKSDRANVSVVPYMPETPMSVSDYFDAMKAMMDRTSGVEGFELLSSETEGVTLGGCAALLNDYTYRVGGNTYRYRQWITNYRGMIYSLTYTARPEHFDAHLADVERIVSAFVFR